MNWNYTGSENNEDEEELNSRVGDLENKIRSLIDKHAPVKIFRTDSSKMNWMTKELVDRIAARNTMKSTLDKNGGSNEQWKRWRQF